MQKETLVPGSISEEELIRLVDTYSGVLLGLCRLTLGDTAMAQDIVQETFLRAAEARVACFGAQLPVAGLRVLATASLYPRLWTWPAEAQHRTHQGLPGAEMGRFC